MSPKDKTELPESVARGLEALRQVPPPHPERWAAQRQAFLDQARRLRPESVTSGPLARHKQQKSLTTRWWPILFAKEAHPMVTLVKLMVIFSLMFGASAGAANAAQSSLPGDALYPVKLALEQSQVAMTAQPEAKLERLLTMAQTRLQEAQALSEAGKEIPPTLANRYQLHLKQAEALIAGADEAQRDQLRTRLETRLQEHQEAMTQLAEQVRTRAQSEEALQQMLKTQEQVRQRLQQHLEDGTPGWQNGGQTPGGPQGPGPNPTGTPQGPGGPGPNPTGTPQGPGGPGPNPTGTPQGPGGPGPNRP